MSFEGYYQILCANRHCSTPDVYDDEVYDTDITQDWRCPECGEKAVWYNLVDLTNGSFDGKDQPTDGYIELKQLLAAKRCPKCRQMIEPVRYEIPKKGGHLVRENIP